MWRELEDYCLRPEVLFVPMTDPILSVVVTVVDGGQALRRCMQALLSQERTPSMEILVPFDATVEATVRATAADAAGGDNVSVRLVDLGAMAICGRSGAGGQHELIDRRRAAGLAQARGELIAIVEDRAVPRPDWAATVVSLHRQFPNAVIGGAIENACDRVLNWAVYFCDFGRYQLPFVSGPRRYVSDVNVAYKRRALEQTRDIWQVRYHEPLVHWALEQAGEVLLVSPDLVVDEIRDDLRLTDLIVERLAWGRLFGSLRVRDASLARRLAYAAVSPLVPGVLFARFVRDRVVRGTPLGRLLGTAPAVLLLMCAWTAGEAAGCLAGESPADR